MKTNKVYPWEGRLVWVGTPRSGTSRNEKDWTSVDFVLEYTDDQDKQRHIMFNLFGGEKVDELFTKPIGTKLLVKWTPDARESNGRWWSQNSAYEVTSNEEAKPSTELPQQAPAFQPNTQTARPSPKVEKVNPQEEDEDLPFN